MLAVDGSRAVRALSRLFVPTLCPLRAHRGPLKPAYRPSGAAETIKRSRAAGPTRASSQNMTEPLPRRDARPEQREVGGAHALVGGGDLRARRAGVGQCR